MSGHHNRSESPPGSLLIRLGLIVLGTSGFGLSAYLIYSLFGAGQDVAATGDTTVAPWMYPYFVLMRILAAWPLLVGALVGALLFGWGRWIKRSG